MLKKSVEDCLCWKSVLPDLLIESEALTADMFGILLYKEHVYGCVAYNVSWSALRLFGGHVNVCIRLRQPR
jgi:hypothetical protein